MVRKCIRSETTVVERPPIQMAGHPSMVCGKPSVSSVCYNELVPCLTERVEILHQMAGDKNKSKRQLFPDVAITDKKH